MKILFKFLKICGLFLMIPGLLVAGCKDKDIADERTPYIIGTITKIRLFEVPNKAKGKPSRFETRITLSVTKEFDGDDNPIDIKDYDNSIFAGTPELVEQYRVSQKVKIVCNSQSGRHIKEITLVE